MVSELSISKLLTGWEHEVKPAAMAEWKVEKEPLVDLFGRVRDDWMDHDLHTWIAANRQGPLDLSCVLSQHVHPYPGLLYRNLRPTCCI